MRVKAQRCIIKKLLQLIKYFFESKKLEFGRGHGFHQNSLGYSKKQPFTRNRTYIWKIIFIFTKNKKIINEWKFKNLVHALNNWSNNFLNRKTCHGFPSCPPQGGIQVNLLVRNSFLIYNSFCLFYREALGRKPLAMRDIFYGFFSATILY